MSIVFKKLKPQEKDIGLSETGRPRGCPTNLRKFSIDFRPHQLPIYVTHITYIPLYVCYSTFVIDMNIRTYTMTNQGHSLYVR